MHERTRGNYNAFHIRRQITSESLAFQSSRKLATNLPREIERSRLVLISIRSLLRSYSVDIDKYIERNTFVLVLAFDLKNNIFETRLHAIGNLFDFARIGLPSRWLVVKIVHPSPNLIEIRWRYFLRNIARVYREVNIFNFQFLFFLLKE